MTTADNRTIADLVRNALRAQHHRRLREIVWSFQADLERLFHLVSDTDIRRHPVCVLYAGKIAQLTGSEVGSRYRQAMEWCVQVRDTGDVGELPRDDN